MAAEELSFLIISILGSGTLTGGAILENVYPVLYLLLNVTSGLYSIGSSPKTLFVQSSKIES